MNPPNPNCPFCQIIQGDKPCYQIHETPETLAFLDTHHHAYGHTLIIPKTHHPLIWDMPHPGDLLNVAQILLRHYQTILPQTDYFTATWGRLVPHAHLHLLPQIPKNSESLESIATKLRLPLNH